MTLDEKLREILLGDLFMDGLPAGIHQEPLTKTHIKWANKMIAQIKQAFAESTEDKKYKGNYPFDQHLRTYLPHDGKWRHVEFNVKIEPTEELEFKERGLMTGAEWLARFKKYYDEETRGIPHTDHAYKAAKRASTTGDERKSK